VRAPPVQAVLERRLFINYCVDPDVLASMLPAPFRPALVADRGVAGICLIRLGALRPAGLTRALGFTSENAAHRVAVCWDGDDGPVTGVYIPRRETSSRLITLAGGRIFPGWHHRARFDVDEGESQYRIALHSLDGAVHVEVDVHTSDRVMPGSVFANLDEASQFFRGAPAGYAATPREGVFDGVELHTGSWILRPMGIDEVSSSFFDDPNRFPPGTATLDSAFLMGGISTLWRPQPNLLAAS
jgi:hypothetical protein